MGLDGKKTKLVQSDITKVDFVPSGAQADSHIEIFKADENDLVDGCIDHLEAVAKEGRIFSKASLSKLKTIHEQLANIIQGSEVEQEKEAIKMGDNVEKVDGKVCPTCKKEMGVCSCKKVAPGEDMGVSKMAPETPVEKTGPTVEEVMKMFQAQKEENDILKQAVAKMADDRLNQEYIAKAAQFDNLGMSAEELGPVLKSISVAVPESYAKLEAVLKAANEAINQGGIFQELGITAPFATSVVSKSDAWGQITALADGIVAKSNTSQAQAITQILDTPEGKRLYALYTGK